MAFLKVFLASSGIVFLFLGIWINSYFYNCFAFVIPFIMITIIGSTFIELKIQERNCFKNCYFISSSFIAKILSSRFLIVLFYVIASVMMTLSVLYNVLDFSKMLWVYLFFLILLMVSMYKLFIFLFKNIFKKQYSTLFAREWSINVASILTIVIYIYISFHSYEPSYLRETLQETVRVASNSIGSNCEVLNYFLKIQREIDSMLWWYMEKAIQIIQNKDYRFLAWLGFLLINSFAILGLNRFIAQIIYLIDKFFTSMQRGTNE